jgi:hypothetical protein
VQSVFVTLVLPILTFLVGIFASAWKCDQIGERLGIQKNEKEEAKEKPSAGILARNMILGFGIFILVQVVLYRAPFPIVVAFVTAIAIAGWIQARRIRVAPLVRMGATKPETVQINVLNAIWIGAIALFFILHVSRRLG